MSSLQNHYQDYSDLAAKQALRAHFEQMPLCVRREFVAVALQLIAERALIDEVEELVSYQMPLPWRTEEVLN